jgi:hypothetical protein
MKTMGKLGMLLAVLAICMPAQGEILIYSKQYECWGASSADMLVWNADEWAQRGYLVLDVDYDPNGEPNEILQAEQIEFNRRDKEFWQITEDYDIERIEVGRDVIWVIEYVYGDGFGAEIIMLKGTPKNMNIGLGIDAKREVARKLTGYMMYFYGGMGIQKQMCTMSLRLHGGWTKCANKPVGDDGCDQDFDCAKDNIVKARLIRKGYVEVI